MKKTGRERKGPARSRGVYTAPLLLFLIGLAGTALIYVIHASWEKDSRSTVIYNIVTRVRMDAAEFHLWIEDSVASEEPMLDFEERLAVLKGARTDLVAAIRGGTTAAGRTVDPAADPAVADGLRAADRFLVEFIVFFDSTYAPPYFEGAGGVERLGHDELFSAFMDMSDALGAVIERARDETHRVSHRLHLITLFIWAALTLAATVWLTLAVRRQRAADEEVYRLSRAVEQSPVTVMITDAEGMIEYVNPAFTAITGYDAEEAVGQTPRFLKSGHTSDEVYKELWETITSGREWCGVFHNRKKGGELYWESATISALKNLDGVITNFIGIKEDITERVEAEERAAYHTERLGRLAELAATLSGEPDEIFKKAVPMIGELLGVPVVCLSEVRGEELHCLSMYVDGEVTAGEGSVPLDTTPCSTVVASREMRVYNDVAERFPESALMKEYDIRSYCGLPAFDSYGEVVAVICLLDSRPREFTDEDKAIFSILGQRIGAEIERKRSLADGKRADQSLKESEERLRTTLRSIGDAVITIDMKGTVTFMNHVAEALTGWTAEEAAGVDLQKVFDVVGGDAGGVLSEWESAAASSHPVANVVLRKKDGGEVPMEGEYSPVINDRGEAGGYVLAFRDVTDRIKREEERGRLEKLESLGVLAGGIAHDFNNLLTGIVGNVSLMRLFIEDREKLLGRITQAEKVSGQAQGLTGRLLTFSRGGEPVKKAVAVAPLLDESVRIALTGTGVVCECDIADGLPPIDADRDQVNYALSSIIKNSVEAMDGSGTVRIKAEGTTLHEKGGAAVVGGGRERGGDGAFVKVTIADDGPGIPKENLGKIFDPYFTTKDKGSGLGLTSAYSIIKRHGGRIEVESEPGKGTVVDLYLSVSAAAATASVKVAEEVYVGSGRVLVMDDDESIRELLSAMLPVIGYEVDTAADGAEALALYSKSMESGSPYDAVIMDLVIPGAMGGEEAIKRLLKMDPAAKAIVSSGYSDVPVVARYRDYGFVGVMPKPYRKEELSKVLHNVLYDEKGE